MERFRIEAPDDALRRLRRRLDETRWPAPVDDDGRWGIARTRVRHLVERWRQGFDWRAQEQRLNAFDHRMVDLDGQRVHIVRRAAAGPAPIPILLLHGWPGSFVQMLDLAERLADPSIDGAPARYPFEVVVPSLPGFGYSEQSTGDRFGVRGDAELLDRLMTERLGFARYAVHGTDFGGGVADWITALHPEHLIGMHGGGTSPRADGVTEQDPPALQRYAADVARWRSAEVGYGQLQSTRPDTLAFALTDSPVGLLAWLAEKLDRWSDDDLTDDQILTNVMIYWLTGTIGTSMRRYTDPVDDPDLRGSPVPIAYLMPQRDMLPTPREWLERRSRIDRWTAVEHGGHFIEWERPDLVADDIRAFFRSLR